MKPILKDPQPHIRVQNGEHHPERVKEKLRFKENISKIRISRHPGCWRTPLSDTYPELSAKDVDFPLGLLLPEPPLHQVLAVLPGEGHVPLGHGWVGGAGQHVRLRLVVGVEPAGVDDPQGAVVADLVAVSQLVCGTSSREREPQAWMKHSARGAARSDTDF